MTQRQVSEAGPEALAIDADVVPRSQPAHRTSPSPLPSRPGWALRSVVEDDGVTHEWVAPVRPLVVAVPDGLRPSEVSVSVTDRWDGRGWVRSGVVVQVEGGTLPVVQAFRLRAVLDDVLSRIADG
jgi:hypothetical protein